MEKALAKLTNTQKVQVLAAARLYNATGKPPKMVGWSKDMQKAFCLATQVSSYTRIKDNSDN